jgi:hypothetical protein
METMLRGLPNRDWDRRLMEMRKPPVDSSVVFIEVTRGPSLKKKRGTEETPVTQVAPSSLQMVADKK